MQKTEVIRIVCGRDIRSYLQKAAIPRYSHGLCSIYTIDTYIRTFKINVLVLKFTARPAVQVYTRINTLLYLTREYLPQRYHDGHCITVNFPVRYYSDHSRSSGPKSRTFTYPLLGVPIHTVYIGMLRCAHDVAWPRYVRRERDMSSVPTLAHRTPKTIAAYNII